jgi:putative restriction endonuclease
MRAGHKDWTRAEHILAFNLYCKIPFGRQHSRAPEIIELARLLGRSANSVALKLNNFSRLDPELQARGIRGMAHGAKGEIEVWRDFEDDPEALAFESERLLAKLKGCKLEEIAEIDYRDLPEDGIERERMVRVRVNFNSGKLFSSPGQLGENNSARQSNPFNQTEN